VGMIRKGLAFTTLGVVNWRDGSERTARNTKLQLKLMQEQASLMPGTKAYEQRQEMLAAKARFEAIGEARRSNATPSPTADSVVLVLVLLVVAIFAFLIVLGLVS
jgi:hypothetical protein